MPLNDVPWTRPVTIRLQCGLERTFTGVYDALDFLENEWPLRNGERHERAVKNCRGAINVVLGIWAVVAPWALGFSAITAATWVHVIAGIVVAVLAAGNIWFNHNHPLSTA